MNKKELIKKLLEATTFNYAIHEKTFESLARSYALSTNKKVDEKAISHQVGERLKNSQLLDDAISLYDTSFTEEEIEKLHDFYTSDLVLKHSKVTESYVDDFATKYGEIIKDLIDQIN